MALQRVLYVEDDPHIQKVVALTLEEHGLIVQCCGNWQDAVTKASQMKPDLLLIDVMLPEKNGAETLRALRDLPGLSLVPAIFLTVDVTLSTISNLKELGPYAIIAKPFQVNRLYANILEKWNTLSLVRATEL